MTNPVEKNPPARRGLGSLPVGVRIIVALVVVAFGLFQFRNGLLELFPSIGADADVTAAAQKATSAAKRFTALAQDAYQTGKPPRQTDAVVGPLLDAVFDVDLLQKKPTLAKGDLQGLSDWEGAALSAAGVYILAGTGKTDFSQVTNDPKLLQLIDRNTAAYAPEIGRYEDAQLGISGAIAQIVAANSSGAGPDGKPNLTDGQQKVRDGIATTINGVLQTFVVDGISDDWRRARLAALDSVAPKAAKLFTAEQCGAVRDTSRAVSAAMGNSEIKAGLATFDSALKC
jgi:hypothetical protein